MLTEGQLLEGKYKVGRLLGRGGMGAVFLGENTRIKRTVAIKVLHDVDPESENARRFENEAQAAGQIGSDHIVEVLDVGTTPDGDRFMVMEYLDGESLKTRLQRGRLQPPEVVALVTQVLEGLAAAHAAGIVHRDLKPDNVFILKSKAGRRDFVKIVDFGISKFNALGSEGGMTKTGAVMGTPFYMSPEQARAANEVDNRSDLYAAGVLMYEAATGAVPFNGNTYTELLFKIVFEDAPHPNTLVPDLDPGFAGIILKAMARDPSDRYQTAGELQEALSQWRPGVAAAPPGAPANGAGPLGGTAILDVSSHPLAHSQPHPLAQSRPHPLAQGQPHPLAHSQPHPLAHSQPHPLGAAQPPFAASAQAFAPAPVPLAQSGPQPVPAAWQSPQGLAQSVSSGSQVLDAPPAPPKNRAGVVAIAAVLLLGIGGAAAFLATRPPKEPAGTAAEAATATVTTAAAPTAAATAAPSAAATPAEVPSAAPSSEPAASASASADPPQRRAGAWPPPSAKPSTTGGAKTPRPVGTLKDLGY